MRPAAGSLNSVVVPWGQEIDGVSMKVTEKRAAPLRLGARALGSASPANRVVLEHLDVDPRFQYDGA